LVERNTRVLLIEKSIEDPKTF